MQISVGCKLKYSLATVTGFVLKIQAAKADSQYVKSEMLHLPSGDGSATYSLYVDPVTSTRIIRTMLGPGDVEVRYEALVDVEHVGVDPVLVQEFQFANLPMEYLEYLAPSRYCPSDTFTAFAHQMFGSLPAGHTRVTALCDWIFSNIVYRGGSTGPNSTAVDVFHSRAGVCRDFAHLGISLCRALGIPARYASVYADALNPQDFHAVFQAYLFGPNGGAWYNFDATRMSSSDAIVRIASGRDAADVAFAWPQAVVEYQAPIVFAQAAGRVADIRTNLAIPG